MEGSSAAEAMRACGQQRGGGLAVAGSWVGSSRQVGWKLQAGGLAVAGSGLAVAGMMTYGQALVIVTLSAGKSETQTLKKTNPPKILI